ncbi:hypothetical protein [Bradyrhizobium roseum]|uniref:hypothetical protein n=1 Tax=Bradyrhizobium roseum TaxID=3056648 RepID=UPI0026190D3D|nr:hypothetical protein [Bradyrhizobium roseus]WKA31606.1 hypothetical protein QUH67_16230 [Bradyrhizobium roseus]
MPRIEKLATDNLTVATFSNLSIKDDAASKTAGRPIYNDVPVCTLKFSANKQTVGVFPAHEIFRWHDDPESGERTPLTYALAFPDQYRAFMNGEAQFASGTPLSELPFITQGKRLELKAINIHTAEALAVIDGNALKMLGLGGRALKEQAQAYLDTAAGTADVTAIAAENADLKARLAALEARISGAPAGETMAIPAAAAAADDQSPFFIMEPEDIRNWLVETTGKTPAEGLNHPALVKLADQVNAALAAKASGLDRPLDDLSDDELREHIKAKSGKAPAHNAGRASLLARAAELGNLAAA